MVQLAQGGMTAPQGPVINPKAGDAADPKTAQRNATAAVTAADFAALFAALPGEADLAAPGTAGRAPLPPGGAATKLVGAPLNAARRPNAALAEIPWVELPAVAPPVELPVIALAAGLFPPPILTPPPQDNILPAADPTLMAAALAAAMPSPMPITPPDATLPDPAGMAAAGMPMPGMPAAMPPQNALPAPLAAPSQEDPAAPGIAAAPSPQAAAVPPPLPAQGFDMGQAPPAEAAPVVAAPAMPPAQAVAAAPAPAVATAVTAPALPPAAMAVPTASRPATADGAGNPPPLLATAVAQAGSSPVPAGVVIRPAGAPGATLPGTSSATVRTTRMPTPAPDAIAGTPPVAESRADGLPILTEALVGVLPGRREAADAETPSPGQSQQTAATPSVTPSLAMPQQVVSEVAARPHDVVQPMDLAAALASSAAAIATPGAAPPAAAPPATMAPLPPQLAAEARHQVALRVASAVSSGVDTVSVDLRPPELGRVEVRLTFHEGSVQVVVAAERAATYEAFRQDRAHLEQQLAQAGFDLGGGALDLRHGGLPREREPEPPKPASTAAAAPVDGPAEDVADQSAADRRRLSNSLIDFIA